MVLSWIAAVNLSLKIHCLDISFCSAFEEKKLEIISYIFSAPMLFIIYFFSRKILTAFKSIFVVFIILVRIFCVSFKLLRQHRLQYRWFYSVTFTQSFSSFQVFTEKGTLQGEKAAWSTNGILFLFIYLILYLDSIYIEHQ